MFMFMLRQTRKKHKRRKEKKEKKQRKKDNLHLYIHIYINYQQQNTKQTLFISAALLAINSKCQFLFVFFSFFTMNVIIKRYLT